MGIRQKQVNVSKTRSKADLYSNLERGTEVIRDNYKPIRSSSVAVTKTQCENTQARSLTLNGVIKCFTERGGTGDALKGM